MEAQPRLIVEGRGNWVYTHRLGLKPRVVMGRSGDCDLVVDDVHCSSQHAEIAQEEGEYILRDLNSRNGTFFNGKQVKEAKLRNGANIRIGVTSMSFITGEDESFISSSANLSGVIPASAIREPDSALRPIIERLDSLKSSLRNSGSKVGEADVTHAVDDLERELEVARGQIRKLSAANEFAHLIRAQSTSLDTVIGALDFIARQVQGENGFIMQIDPARRKWVVRAKFGKIFDWAREKEGEANQPLPMSLTLVEQVIRTGEPVTSTSAIDDPRFDSSKSIVALGIHACICYPMLSQKKPAGVVYVDRRENPRPFNETDRELFAELTSQLAGVLYAPAQDPA